MPIGYFTSIKSSPRDSAYSKLFYSCSAISKYPTLYIGGPSNYQGYSYYMSKYCSDTTFNNIPNSTRLTVVFYTSRNSNNISDDLFGNCPTLKNKVGIVKIPAGQSGNITNL